MFIIPCTVPVVTPLVVILSIALIGQILFLRRSPSKRYRLLVLAQVVLLTFILGLGSYRISPLYSGTNILSGFNVMVGDKPSSNVKSGEIITLGQNSTVILVPLTLPGTTISCNWSSQNGGALDDPGSCETIYAPPAADYDILRLSVRSRCGLSDAVGQIKFSILP